MKQFSVALLVCLSLSAMECAEAEVVRRGGGDGASAMLQQQMQQIAIERDSLLSKQAELLAENEKLAKELKGSKKKLTQREHEISSLKTQLGEASRATEHAEKVGSVTEAKLKITEERLQKVVGKYRELVADLRKSEERAATLEVNLGQKGDSLDQCTKDNRTLYQAARELLEKYEDKGVWDALLQHEPVTQIKQAEIETVGEHYRDVTDQSRFEPKSAASASAVAEQ